MQLRLSLFSVVLVEIENSS